MGVRDMRSGVRDMETSARDVPFEPTRVPGDQAVDACVGRTTHDPRTTIGEHRFTFCTLIG